MKWRRGCLKNWVFFLCCVFLPAKQGACLDATGEQEASPMRVMLNQYRAEQYTVLGPVQYLGKDTDAIEVFRYGRIPYRFFDAKSENGGRCFPNKRDYVYVASNNGHVVLFCIDLEGKHVK